MEFKKVKQVITSLLLSALISPTFAGGSSGSPVKITQINTYKGGIVRLYINANHSNPDQCNTSSNKSIYLSPPAVGATQVALDAHKNLFSTALAAFTADKNVTFYLNGCTDYSGNTSPEVSRISIIR